MAHLASRVLHWAVNLAGKSSLHSADSLTKHHSTACSDFSHDRLSSTVGRDRWRDRCTSFTMQCIRVSAAPPYWPWLMSREDLCLHLQALTVDWLVFTLDNYRTQCKPLVPPVCLDRVCMWRRSLTVIVCFVWIFSFTPKDKYNKDY